MLDQLALPDLDVVARWNKAPIGALVQVTLDNKPAIGWRCAFPSRIDCLLIVDGDKTGRLLMSNIGTVVPGIDVSRVVELVAIEPGISDMTSVDFRIGTVVWSGGSLFVQTISRDTGLACYACIASAVESRNVGLVFLNIPAQLRVAKAIGIRPRTKPLPVGKKSGRRDAQ